MIEIKIHKAGSLTLEYADPAKILISEHLPEDNESASPIEDIYAFDAKELARVLAFTLPQGTMDRLLVELLKRSLSSFKGTIK